MNILGIRRMAATAAASAAFVMIVGAPALASNYDGWTAVREGSGTQATDQPALFTSAREAGTTYSPVILSSASVRESGEPSDAPAYGTLAQVREGADAGGPQQASTFAFAREGGRRVPLATVAQVEETTSNPADEIVVASALVATFLIGIGLGSLVSRRRIPSAA